MADSASKVQNINKCYSAISSIVTCTHLLNVHIAIIGDVWPTYVHIVIMVCDVIGHEYWKIGTT